MLDRTVAALDESTVCSLNVHIVGKKSYLLSRLGNLIEDGYQVLILCGAQTGGEWCRHSAYLDLDYLRRRFGLEFEVMHHTVAPMLRCSKCGAKGVPYRGPIRLQLRVPSRAFGSLARASYAAICLRLDSYLRGRKPHADLRDRRCTDFTRTGYVTNDTIDGAFEQVWLSQ